MTTSAAGKVPVIERCPEQLTEAVAERNLVIFCGAGISNAPPAAVPSWAGFNEALFREIKTRAAELPRLPAAGAEILASLSVIGTGRSEDRLVPTEGFSDTVADLLLSDEYLPALQVLDGEACNANHLAVATLARRGVLRAIATTNFDTLIERALREEGVDFRRFITQQDYNLVEARRSPTLELYKVHGSADAPDSLKDTATQKFRGLPLYVRMKLAELFRRHHVLVLGFSGGDLKFGEDYFGFERALSESAGITWVVRPPRQAGDALVSPRVGEMLEAAGVHAAVLKSDLSDVFAQLGVLVRDNARVDAKAAEARANARTAEFLAAFFKRKSVARLRCAALCAYLLRSAGRVEEARLIEAAIAEVLPSEIGGSGALDTTTVAIMMARAAADESDMQRSYDWTMRAWRLVEAAKPHRTERDATMWSKLEALTWNCLGLACISNGQDKDASRALEKAKAATPPGEVALRSMNASNEAYLAARTGAPDDRVLTLVRRSAALARCAGDMRALAAAAHFESRLFIALGEYDSALRALEAGGNAVSVSGDVRDRAALVVQHAQIARARGQLEEAFAAMQQLIGELSDHPELRAGLTIVATTMLGFHAPLRPNLLLLTKSLITDYESGRLPPEGLPPNVPSRSEVEALRGKLATDEPPGADSFPSFPNAPRNHEEELRRTIIAAEFAGARDALPAQFLALFELELDDANPARLMDIAYALVCAAERTGEEQLKVIACSQRMVACQRAGEFQRGLREFEQLQCSDAMQTSAAFVGPLHFAGLFLSFIGTMAEAEARLRQAMALSREHGLLPGAAMAALGLARAFALNNEYTRAAEILAEQRDLIASAGEATLVAQAEELNALFLRRQQRRESAMPMSVGLNEPLRIAALTAADVASLRAMADSAEDLLELARWFLGADLPQTARSLVLEASLHFGELRDERGLADCLLFLADIAQTQRQWDKAHEFARMAADVSARMEDLDREIASRAVAAFCLYRLEDFPWAEKAALRCLNCGEGQHPSRPLLIACFVRAACCEQRGDLLGKLGAMSGFLQVFPALSGVEDLIPLRDSFQRALTPVH